MSQSNSPLHLSLMTGPQVRAAVLSFCTNWNKQGKPFAKQPSSRAMFELYASKKLVQITNCCGRFGMTRMRDFIAVK